MRGRVQGVNFRAAASHRAAALGVTGRVWNRDDRAVEVVAEGEPDALATFERWLGRGPRLAHVLGVERRTLEGGPAFADFGISEAQEGPSGASDPRT